MDDPAAASTSDPTGFLPLTDVAFHLLLALGDGPSHGYAMGKEMEERTEGRLNPTTGALYQALKRLREDGLVELDDDATAASPDARRRYFRLTGLGRRVLRAEARRLDGLVGAVRAKGILRSS